MYSAVGSQFFSQLHKAFVLSLQVMAVNPGITFCEPGWIASEVTLQYRNTVIVGIEIIFPVSQLTGRIQLPAKLLVFNGAECQDLILLQHKHYFLLARKSHYGFFQKHN